MAINQSLILICETITNGVWSALNSNFYPMKLLCRACKLTQFCSIHILMSPSKVVMCDSWNFIFINNHFCLKGLNAVAKLGMQFRWEGSEMPESVVLTKLPWYAAFQVEKERDLTCERRLNLWYDVLNVWSLRLLKFWYLSLMRPRPPPMRLPLSGLSCSSGNMRLRVIVLSVS